MTQESHFERSTGIQADVRERHGRYKDSEAPKRQKYQGTGREKREDGR